MANINLTAVVDKIQDEVKLITATLKDKGSNRFGRTFLIALALPAGAYFLVYGQAQKRMDAIAGELQVARNTAKHADTYKDLKDRLLTTYPQLPLPKDRADLLSDVVKEALRGESIVSLSFRPPTETEMPGGIVQNLSINIRVKFPELMAFLARVESHKPAIHVSNIELAKKDAPMGTNEVNCTLSTIILMERH
jgi:Tfp pilus assembly protein PilO